MYALYAQYAWYAQRAMYARAVVLILKKGGGGASCWLHGRNERLFHGGNRSKITTKDTAGKLFCEECQEGRYGECDGAVSRSVKWPNSVGSD